jgi:hypothetical protein
MSSYRSTEPSLSKQRWYATSSLVEGALFVSVQAIMLVCVALVAVQALSGA